MDEGLVILTHDAYIDDSDVVNVVGQVYNNTTRNYQWVVVKCEFYDKEDKLLAEEETYAYIDILLPDEKAPFRLFLWETPAGLERYVVSVEGDETTEQPAVGIQFVQDNGSIEENNLYIIGEVTNTGETPVSQVRIAAAVYDENGDILDVGFTYAERDVFVQDKLSPFELYVSATNGTPDSYELIVYGQEAADYELEQLADLDLTSIDYYIDTFDDLIIVGEVANDDSQNVAFVLAFASFYNEADELVAVGWGYAWADILEPGNKSPFSIELYNTPEEVDHWIVWFEGDVTDDPVAGKLVLEDTDNTLDDDYVATFVGNVKNNGTETMTSIQIAVTVYDADGEVVTVGQTWLDDDLAPDGTMPFEFDVQASDAADSFKLYVQGSVKTD